MEMTSEESLPLYARTSMLKFILGPAEFVLHHLETRIQLSEKIDILVIDSSFTSKVESKVTPPICSTMLTF